MEGKDIVKCENLAMIGKEVRSDGIGRISFGGPVVGEMRWGKNNPPRPPTFDDINDADTVYQIASRLHEQVGKSSAAPSGWPFARRES